MIFTVPERKLEADFIEASVTLQLVISRQQYVSAGGDFRASAVLFDHEIQAAVRAEEDFFGAQVREK